MKRKPMQNSPSRLDRLMQREMDSVDNLIKREGLAAAKDQVLAQLMAGVYFINKNYGSREAYTLFQQLADQMAAPVLQKDAA
jgi:hypothetical protein